MAGLAILFIIGLNASSPYGVESILWSPQRSGEEKFEAFMDYVTPRNPPLAKAILENRALCDKMRRDEYWASAYEGSSRYAFDSFNRYIVTQSPELGMLILDDDELVYSMRMNIYWYPPERIHR